MIHLHSTKSIITAKRVTCFLSGVIALRFGERVLVYARVKDLMLKINMFTGVNQCLSYCKITVESRGSAFTFLRVGGECTLAIDRIVHVIGQIAVSISQHNSSHLNFGCRQDCELIGQIVVSYLTA